LAEAGDAALQSGYTGGYETTSKEPIVAPVDGRIIDAWMQQFRYVHRPEDSHTDVAEIYGFPQHPWLSM
jgi:hypothetical protein